jgi:hypothetical protein
VYFEILGHAVERVSVVGKRVCGGLLNARSQRFPHRSQVAWQVGQSAQFGVALVRAVEVAASGRSQSELTCRVGVNDVLGGTVATRDHFNTLAAMRLEFGEERELLVRSEFVPRRVCNDGHAAGSGNPGDGILE